MRNLKDGLILPRLVVGAWKGYVINRFWSCSKNKMFDNQSLGSNPKRDKLFQRAIIIEMNKNILFTFFSLIFQDYKD